MKYILCEKFLITAKSPYIAPVQGDLKAVNIATRDTANT